MRKIVVLAAIAGLAACSKPAPAPADDASTTAAAVTTAAPAGTVAADGKPSTGTFRITMHDGKILTQEVKADGTYADTIEGKPDETGKWEQKAPGVFCETSDAKDAKQRCNEEKVENGVWTSKGPDGKVATIVRIAG